MRTFLTHRPVAIVLASLALCTVTDCGGSKNNASPSGLTNGTFTATINGKAFTASLAIIATRSGNLVSVSGTDATTNLAFAVVATGPGTYSIPGSGAQAGNDAGLTLSSTSDHGNWSAGLFNGSGTIKIDTLTSSGTSGTFSLTLTPTTNTGASGNKTITNGKFDVKFTSAAG